jgi:hypothetical protein
MCAMLKMDTPRPFPLKIKTYSVQRNGRYLLKRFSSHVILIFLILICGLPSSIQAQKTTQKKTPAKRRVAKPVPTPTPAALPDMHPEASKVATQINNISLFLYTYGKVVNSLEIADQEAKRNQPPPDVLAKNKASKTALINNIAALRAGLTTLMKEFQGSTRLQVQYLKISFATESVVGAERLVSAGRYDEAGKALVQTIERLTDVMLSMRLQ